MTEKMSRQQKRQLLRESAKKQFQENKEIPTQENFVSQQRFDLLIQDVQRILNYIKTVDNHSFMLMETLSKLNIVKWKDLKETEKLFRERDQRKKDKVKDLLSRDLSVEEYINEIEEDDDLPNYEKLRIHPIKDLNLNPYEVASFIKEKNPDLTKEQYLALGKKWELSEENFGYKKEETSEEKPEEKTKE